MTRPRDVVAMRRELLEWYGTIPGRCYFADLEYRHSIEYWRTSPTGRPLLALYEYLGLDRVFEMQMSLLRDAPLYFVTEDMQGVVAAASAELPALDAVSFEDLPSEEGLMVWAAPFTRIGDEKGEQSDLVGAMWRCIHDANGPVGVLIDLYEDSTLGEVPEGMYRPAVGELPHLLHASNTFFPVGSMSMEGHRVPADSPAAHVLAALLMLRQRCAEVETERAQRAEWRRCGRARCSSDVRVIYLRGSRGGAGQSHRSVEWSHRWVVGGHWRDQPYPTLGITRPKWISPYVKGPEDAPLRLRETVRVLSR